MNCLRNHKRLHVAERTYFNCDRCDKKYTQKVSYEFQGHDALIKIFRFKVQLKKHIEIVHMQRRDYCCSICGASFGTNSVLKMHFLSHQDFRAEKCEVRSITICWNDFMNQSFCRRSVDSAFTPKPSCVVT